MNQLAPLSPTETMLTFTERVLRDPTIDVGKLEHIIQLQERVAAREARRQFAEAMNALQREMPLITKDRANPHTRSRYATYESIDAILRPLYTTHGFSVSFTTHAEASRIRVGCTVSHVGGHSESEHSLESGPDMTGSKGQANKTEVQGVGSIVSYLKRYTLMAAFAVAVQDDETDDDGAPRGRSRAFPVYPFITARGPVSYDNAAQWLERWRRLVEACQLTDALAKLREARDMNSAAFDSVLLFDNAAANEVRELLAAVLDAPQEQPQPAEPPAHEPMSLPE